MALLVGPFAVRQFVNAQTTVEVRRASERLVQSAPGAPGNVLEQMNALQRDIARAVEPSVVHVSTQNTVHRRAANQIYVSSGSGWVFDGDGHIITNGHVVDGADRIEVQFHDGELRAATLVGLDLRTDIAVLKVEGPTDHPAARGNSDDLQQGDLVYAFGSPFDFRFSMSSGIVSGLGRTAGPAEIDYQNFIQVDAAINPGNSGGPLTDIYGQVVGMNTAIATGRGNSVGQGQFAGIGLAIPMSMIESVVGQLIEVGEVRKGFLGISVDDPESPVSIRGNASPIFGEVRKRFVGEGALVTVVEPGSPAATAGIKVGDVITGIDGQRISSGEQVRAVISSKRPGSGSVVEVWRLDLDSDKAETLKLSVQLGEMDPVRLSAPLFVSALRSMGLTTLATSTEERAQRLGVPFRRGVLVEEVKRGSMIENALPQGTVITEIVGLPVTTIDEFYARVNRHLRSLTQVTPRLQIPIRYVTPDGVEREDALPLYIAPEARD
jgi:serine protease Do